MNKTLALVLTLSLLTSYQSPVITFAAFKDGNWDIYTLEVDSGQLFRLTYHPAEDRDPALSPDGKKLAFSSRRDGNWEIYLVGQGGDITRLTFDPHYDGRPAWSPDGKRIAFESTRAGDLDIWLMEADGSNQRNLTPDSPYGDAEPAWSPDGRLIAFTSWRFGDKDLFLLDPDSGELTQLTTEPTDEYSPSWSPNGDKLAFVREENGHKAVWVMELESRRAYRLSWLSAEDSPVWLPDGRLAYISYRYDGERLVLDESPGKLLLPRVLLGPAFLMGGLSAAATFRLPGDKLSPSTLSLPTPVQSSERKGLEELDGVDVYDARLSSAVVESFAALRERLRRELGYDFLGRLWEAFRPVDFQSEHSDYASWHKAGRAFDIYFDEKQALIVREELGGETRWRVYLKCAKMDGTCGEPLRHHPWELSYIPGEEGKPGLIPNGYYVDFTQAAREAGWERISAHQGSDFDWRWEYKALEFWHYQKRDGLTWYEAMEQVYPAEELKELFSWEKATEAGVPPHLVGPKGIEIPSDKAFWLKLKK
jgi:TolB protein